MIDINMKNNISRLCVTFVSIIILASFLLGGCTDTLTGEKTPNTPPLVEFVNIPPDYEEFSRNPEVYWIGTDRDGLIAYYRYFVIPQDSLMIDDTTMMDPIQFATDLDDTMWVQVSVDQNEADPQTTQIIPLSADLDDPVNSFVPQYIFLQAFDNLNAPSEIKYKVLNRNDNPPSTRIFHIGSDEVFVNSIVEGGIITGVRLRWEGSDEKDYEDLGLTAPPFDFEWKLFGPFTDSTLQWIRENLVEQVYVSEDAQIYRLGDTLIACDTTIGGPITCDTTVFDSAYFAVDPSSAFLTRDSILNYQDDPVNFNDSTLVRTSWNGVDTWVQNTADTLFNVYQNYSLDTTAQLNFIFWIRARDDAFVSDLTPQFVNFPVIEPRYERDVAIIDLTSASTDFNRYLHVDTARAFWYNTITNWAENNPLFPDTLIFDTAFFKPGEAPATYVGKTGVDYIRGAYYTTSGIPLALLLKHKVLILYNDYYRSGNFISSNKIVYTEILSAMDAGINVWVNWRNPGGRGLIDNPQFYNGPSEMATYFGVEGTSFSSWFNYANVLSTRVEDFKGTYSIDESKWPPLAIDTALLHSRYAWIGPDGSKFGWIDTISSLPEAGWAERSYGTEVMYLYKSVYGSGHPLGALFRYEGAPCGHRYETNIFRSVHFTFTMPSIQTDSAQVIANSVLDWLYDPGLTATKAGKDLENRYPNAAVTISIDEAKARYEQRLLDEKNRPQFIQ